MKSASFRQILGYCLLAWFLPSSVNAYQASISDKDALRQTCSGMWADTAKDTRVELILDKGSTGTTSLAFYSWVDFSLLGRETPNSLDQLGFPLKTYVCTSSSISQGICTPAEEGQFITSLPSGTNVNSTSIQTKRLDLPRDGLKEPMTFSWQVREKGYYCVATVPLTSLSGPEGVGSGKEVEFNQESNHAKFTGKVYFHNKFEGNLPASEYPKLNFYFGLACLYSLIAAIWFYLCTRHRAELLTVQHFISFALLFLIVEMFSQFGYLTYMNHHAIDFSSIKDVDGNKSITGTARTLLVLTSALDAGRNSMSLFLLLIVSMGYGVIRPSLSKSILRKVQALTSVHFIFGLLYSIGTVLIIIESGGAWIFMFIMPLVSVIEGRNESRSLTTRSSVVCFLLTKSSGMLNRDSIFFSFTFTVLLIIVSLSFFAFLKSITLSSFMMWILSSLNSSIEHLTARKQTFKRKMFVSLHRILMGSCGFILLFFIGTSVVFSQSGGEDFAPNSWEYRWFLLDGWVGLLYLFVFSSIAYIWRPTGSNLRMSMSDEIALDEDPEAGQFEIDTFAAPGAPDSDDEDDDEAAKRRKQHAASNSSAAPTPAQNSTSASTSQNPTSHASRVNTNEDVVFEIGDEDEEDNSKDNVNFAKDRSDPSPGYERNGGNDSERKGLMSVDDDDEEDRDGNESKETLVPRRELDKSGKSD